MKAVKIRAKAKFLRTPHRGKTARRGQQSLARHTAAQDTKATEFVRAIHHSGL